MPCPGRVGVATDTTGVANDWADWELFILWFCDRGREDTQRAREKGEAWEHAINSQKKTNKKNCNKPRKFFFFYFLSFLSFTQQMLREWMWCQLLGKLITWHAARLNPANPIIYHLFLGPTVAIVTPSVATATQGGDSKGEALYCRREEGLAEEDGGLMRNESVFFSCPSFLHSE